MCTHVRRPSEGPESLCISWFRLSFINLETLVSFESFERRQNDIDPSSSASSLQRVVLVVA